MTLSDTHTTVCSVTAHYEFFNFQGTQLRAPESREVNKLKGRLLLIRMHSIESSMVQYGQHLVHHIIVEIDPF